MPRFAANLSMMFTEVDFLKRFDTAAEAGFSAVEYMSPYEYDKEQLAEGLRRNNLTQVLHNLPAGDWEAGDRGIACLPDRVDEFKEGVARAIEYATALGCRQVNCLAGFSPQGAEPDVVRQTFVSNLRYAADRLGGAGIRLLTEPLNTRDFPGTYLHRTDQARSIIQEVASDNLRLQYDVYHMQVMEGDLAQTIRDNLDIIQHIQIADNPGRNEPGTGEINYPFLFDYLDKIEYQGWVGCEYRPHTTTTEGLGWVSRYLRSQR